MTPAERPFPTAARVRRPLLQGRQPVAGLWFPADWFDEAARAARLLAAWQAGASAWRFAEGDLLRYAEPREQVCEGLPGWALRREGATLCSAALQEGEAAGLAPADVWIVLGGEVLALQLAQATPLDPARWITVQELALLETFDLREALGPPVLLAPGPRPVRDILGAGVPPASAEQQAFLRALARSRGDRPQAGRAAPARPAAVDDRPARPSAGGRPRWWPLVAAGLGGVLLARCTDGGGDAPVEMAVMAFLLAVLVGGLLALRAVRRAPPQWVAAGQSAPARQGTATPARSGRTPGDTLPRRRLAQAMPQRWREWLARLAVASQLARVLGRQQAAYLRRMMDLFERGELNEALRHALPLGNEAGSLGQAFGTPGRRQTLDLGRQAALAAASIHLGDHLQERLRALYRRSFEQLDRAGRHDEAVFVLAELLQSRDEALDYLEKLQRYSQAAELALAWDRPAATLVRLHCLAGDWRRAVAVARRDNAFANAVLQLEPRWPDVARRLRQEWGETLAQRGLWLAAVEAVWPVEALRAQAGEWLLAAEAAGGVLAARALVQRAVLQPETLQLHAVRVVALRDDPGLHAERAALAAELLALGEPREAVRGLAAAVLPQLLADQALGRGSFDRKQLQRLLALSGDPLLQADLPAGDWPRASVQPLRAGGRPLACQPPAAGAHAIADAACLPDNRFLLALGEAGVAMVDAVGTVLARFAAPAERLVLAHSGQVALALARRDEVWRVSRLELPRRRVTDLGLAAFDHMATEFDGVAWTVGRGRCLQVLDTTRSLQDVLWQVADLPGRVAALTMTPVLEQVVLQADDGTLALWRYRQPSRLLASRDPVPGLLGAPGVRVLHPTRGLIDFQFGPGEEAPSELLWRLPGDAVIARLPWPAVSATALQIWPGEPWTWLDWRDSAQDDQRVLQLIELEHGAVVATCCWPAVSQLRLRQQGDAWLLFDDQGRLLQLDTACSQTRSFALQ
ncbi:bpX6 domain-containing protein [Eleftheria terrae]|uniref:bpX6 domain-containing protein n=1 Tax=Eleftheria terrae TaxID=1597781 RepID=UPI00263B726D|nr:bpX6 domain-containing protein [Eleftheria terrae]WKB53372.1 bpX6 domain-containing protein [Eleftheria terrae]